jgi:hypothetical protein
VKPRPILSRPLDIAAIPPAGVTERIQATAAERSAIAAAHDLPAVKSLSADLAIGRDAGGAITVEGRVLADIVQTCVVSLVPIEQSIDEPIEDRFVVEGSAPAALARSRSETVIDPLSDVPDVVSGPTLDLGQLVLEHFVLAVDPYPRAPGAELPAEFAPDDDPVRESPFAALEALRQKPS